MLIQFLSLDEQITLILKYYNNHQCLSLKQQKEKMRHRCYSCCTSHISSWIFKC